MDSVRELIVRRAEQEGLTLAFLSRKIGKNHAYLQQFIKRGVPRTLPEDARLKLAEALSVGEDALRSNGHRPAGGGHRLVMAGDVRSGRNMGNLAPSDQQLPIFGPAQAGTGAEILTSDPIEFLRSPHALMGTKGGYGILVTGESMIPVLRPGDIALVNPHIPARPSDEVVLQRTDHGTKYGIIKTLIRATPTEWRLQQWNPKRELVKAKREWPECHTVVGKLSRR